MRAIPAAGSDRYRSRISWIHAVEMLPASSTLVAVQCGPLPVRVSGYYPHNLGMSPYESAPKLVRLSQQNGHTMCRCNLSHPPPAPQPLRSYVRPSVHL